MSFLKYYKIWPLVLFVVTTSCNQNKIYDSYQDIENSIWHVDSLLVFDIVIPDSSLSYNLNYNIRYTLNYPYYNLYTSYYLEDSLGTQISSELQEIILIDKKTGEPLGEGLGDLFDREILIFEHLKFPYSGPYQFKVKQFMRPKELFGVVSFGVKIEKEAIVN